MQFLPQKCTRNCLAAGLPGPSGRAYSTPEASLQDLSGRAPMKRRGNVEIRKKVKGEERGKRRGVVPYPKEVWLHHSSPCTSWNIRAAFNQNTKFTK